MGTIRRNLVYESLAAAVAEKKTYEHLNINPINKYVMMLLQQKHRNSNGENEGEKI